MKKILLIITLATGLLGFGSGTARASSFSVGIYPPIVQIQAISPTSISTPFTLENYSDTPVTLDIGLKPFTASDKENGEVQYLDELPGKDPLLFQHVHISDGKTPLQSVTIQPNQQKKLNLLIDLADQEPVSDYYFSVIFVSKQANSSQSNGVSLTPGGIAMNVLLSVGPKTKPQGLIKEFSAPLFVEKGPVPFTVRLRNTGEHAMTPTGSIYIKNMFGQLVGKVDLLDVNILSNTTRSVPDLLQNPEATPSAQVNAIKSLVGNYEKPKAFWGESFLLGPYTADLHVSLSPDGPTYTQTIYFLAMPIQGAVGVMFGILALLFIRDRVKRRLK